MSGKGLAFLSKKSWHTGGLRMQEKVWVAEQKADAESKKIEQLKREKEDERRTEELQKLAAQSMGKDHVTRLDWMYTIRKPSSDAYMTGNATFKDPEEEKELDKIAAKKGGSFWNRNVVDPVRDAENKVKDDPMLQIISEKRKTIKKILDNPIQIKQIKQSKDVQKALKKIEKQKKKEEKKKKKEEKKKQQKEEEEESKESKESKDKKSSDSSSGDSDDAKSKSKPEESKKRTREHSRSKSRSRSRSRSPRRNRRSSRSRSRSRSPKRSRHHYRSRSRSPRRDDRRDHRRDDRRHESSRRRSRSRSRDRSPKRDHRSQRSSKMTEEDRKKKLEAMMQDAQTRHETKFQRIAHLTEFDKKEDNDDGSKNKHATFIDAMNRKIYTQNDETLQDRVRRNIHMIERKTGDSLENEEK